MILSQYLGFGIMGLLGILINIQDIKPEYVKPRLSMTIGGYLHNDMPKFNDRGTPKELYSRGHLRLASTITFFELLDIDFSMEGFPTEKGFVGSFMGGRWGTKLYVTNNMYVEYKHESNHVGDLGNGVTAPSGSFDYVGITVHIGYNDDRKSVFNKLFY